MGPPVRLPYDSLCWMTTAVESYVQMPAGPAGAVHRRPLPCATDRSIVPPFTPPNTMPLPVLTVAPMTPVLSNAREKPTYAHSCVFGCCA